ncbi:hypothetical protein QJS10_CPA16g01753 [Acorus calamus]|uniref:RING-type E3 ubiquitin transferase n=1 Tax=Acorus calamus TaxID=4465 RepID=A0AAV9D276_ACOCL|nr:hypothetical protein QJS10_CPA16g01753 [Acorus calamus]
MTDLDPLLKDLSERKQSVRRNVVNLASELKDARTRLTLQGESFNRESYTRKVVEMKAKGMEDEIARLQRGLEERDGLLEASTSASEQYIKELDALRSQLSVSRATAEASATSAESAQMQCVALLKELDEKNISIKEHEVRVNRLAEQLDHLQKDLQAREVSQSQLKDEVLQMERDVMQSIAKAGNNKDCELQKILAQVSPKNFENISKCLDVRDAEIVRLRDEIRIMSAHWKHKAQELEMRVSS